MEAKRTTRADEREAIKREVMELLDALDTQGQRDLLSYLRELLIKRRPQRLPPIAPEDLDRLSRAYTMRPPGEVPPYLAEYPELVPILFEGRERMLADFGEDTRAVIELITYQEGDEALFVHIQTELSQDEIERRVGRFWRHPDLRQTQAVLLFDLVSRDTQSVCLLLE